MAQSMHRHDRYPTSKLCPTFSIFFHFLLQRSRDSLPILGVLLYVISNNYADSIAWGHLISAGLGKLRFHRSDHCLICTIPPSTTGIGKASAYSYILYPSNFPSPPKKKLLLLHPFLPTHPVILFPCLPITPRWSD